MELAEIKEAFRSGAPVACAGITYRCISALIYRMSGGHVIMRVELTDRNDNSVTIAEPARIERAESGATHHAG